MIKPKQQQPISQSSQGGFTIIESLLAIIVVTILMVGLAPVIVLSVATRVQAKRVERGTEAARAYIDGIRSGAINSTTTGFPVHTSSAFGQFAPPTSPTGLYCVDLDGGGCSSNQDLLIQAFRDGVAAKPENGYRLGIRVYRADAFSEAGTLKTMGSSDPATQGKAQTFTGGLGDRKAPQFETTTEIAGSDTSLKTLCDRIKVNNPSNPSSSCS
ncbi:MULTISPECIES: type II secretion system GspH family protein [unclassified Coleofasciculus]|uniref:type II secretion system GspH family protein n=1 Tax=Cyanophyceae TaxID=3028117 RepID=UPI001682CFC3|nr:MULTISPECIES: type II secretion system GspH family protein [unclassified Coleofasciculus]MBD1882295.1 type II secretion system protein [Coleofasciculus sp. FACHB-T130]MBD2084933.1 type II secretion system protein [Coleofasciculus sp. FACHB-542]